VLLVAAPFLLGGAAGQVLSQIGSPLAPDQQRF